MDFASINNDLNYAAAKKGFNLSVIDTAVKKFNQSSDKSILSKSIKS